MKKLIAFDLDGTLAESKVPITTEMSELLRQLLKKYQVAITSGAEFSRFKTQLLDPLAAQPQELANLHLLPTNGTHYYRYDLKTNQWQQVYAQEILAETKQKIARVIEEVARKLGYWEAKTWGEIIEDRGSQVTFSALGQQAPLEAKKAWDPDGSKKSRLRDAIAAQLPDFSVHSAGLTSVDVTMAGLDKAAAIAKLQDALGMNQSEVVYIGDAVTAGGNDAVVKEAGFETIPVSGPAATVQAIKQLLT